MKKRLLALLMAAAMMMATAACGSETTTAENNTTSTTEQTTEEGGSGEAASTEESTSTESNDTFTVAISYMPDSLSPQTGGSDDYTSMTRPLFDHLFLENIEGGLDYYLADSLEVSEDGLTYTVHLREDATWSDGTPITTADVQFVADYSVYRYGYNRYIRVNGVDGSMNIVDDHTVQFILPEPYNYERVILAGMTLYPSHVFDGDPEALDNATTYYNTPGFVTSGPYTVTEINEDSFVCTARDDYYRGTPQVKTVVMKVIGSGSTREIAFENGEIDYMRLTTADQLEKYSAQSDKYNIYSFPEARLNYLQVNPFGPANLTDEQRQALFMAINPDEILAAAFGSDELATKANSLLTPEISLYNPDTEAYTYDLEGAQALAESSGLSGMTLTYIYNADRPNMDAVAVVIQQQLAQIGVNLSIEGMDSSSFFPRFFAASSYGFNGQETTWDLGTNGWDSMRGSTLNQAYSYLNQADDAWGMTEACGELALAVNTTTDEAKAKQLADELMDVAMDQYRIYPLTYTNYVLVSQKNVTGLDSSPIVPEFADYLGISVNG